MKKYDYSNSTLWVSIILPVIFLIGLFIWALFDILTIGFTFYTQFLAVMIPAFILLSVFGIHNPFRIIVTQDHVIFEGFGRSHQYSWDEIDTLMVKDYGNLGKSFIKIGKFRMVGGRYWVSSKINGYRELIDLLQTKEQMKNSKIQQKTIQKSKQRLVKN